MVSGVDPRVRPQCVWQGEWALPHASAWSLWSELCRRNGFTRIEAAGLLVAEDAVASRSAGLFTTLFATRADAPWLQDATGLSPTARHVACATQGFDIVATALNRLRYCPLCMGERYHTACFQHLALSRCPVHDVELVDTCQVCGRAIPANHEAARRVPFGCGRCGVWLGVPGDPLPPAGTLNSVMTATALSLTRSAQNADGIANRLHRLTPREAAPIAHLSWWNGVDAFVTESTWKPQRRILFHDHDEPEDLLHMGAWRTLADFVVLHAQLCGQPEDVVLEVADAIDRARVPLLRHWNHSLSVWALGVLVSRYGGAAQLSQARRLLAAKARANLFSLTPQASSPVTECAAANNLVVEAELRQEFVATLRQVYRLGRTGLAEIACNTTRHRVPWRMLPAGDAARSNRVEFQWRTWSDRHYRTLISQRRFGAPAERRSALMFGTRTET